MRREESYYSVDQKGFDGFEKYYIHRDAESMVNTSDTTPLRPTRLQKVFQALCYGMGLMKRMSVLQLIKSHFFSNAVGRRTTQTDARDVESRHMHQGLSSLCLEYHFTEHARPHKDTAS